MSNPSVITLSKARLVGVNKLTVCVEDNIGESIHLHINNIRFDFTIHAFIEFSKSIKICQENVFKEEAIALPFIDPFFSFRMRKFLLHICEVKMESIQLKNLRVIVYSKIFGISIPISAKLKQSPVLKYLLTNDDFFLMYEQDSYEFENNVKRLEKLHLSIDSNNYPLNNRYITLFSGQNIIRDGQHRAAILYKKYGPNHEIPVIILSFKKRGYKYSLIKSFGFYAYRLLKIIIKKIISRLR
jgi:hypothetical protein